MFIFHDIVDLFALFERSEPVAIDGGVVDEDFLTIIHGEEAITLFRAKPFD